MKTNKQRLQKFLALVALPLLISASSLAQTFRGSINGTVTDPSGAVIPGAKVTATDVATAVVRDTVSSGAGEFRSTIFPRAPTPSRWRPPASRPPRSPACRCWPARFIRCR